MASHQLIDDYLDQLARRLPADTVDELADGLVETWHRHLVDGIPTEQAARAAIAEFGPADQIVGEFVAQAPGRRTARLLLVTGPVMGTVWGTSLITAEVWTWPVPRSAAMVYGATLVAVVALLAVAATSRRGFRRTWLGTAGGYALMCLDAAMIVTVATVAPVFVWPMAVAVLASIVRIGLAIRHLPLTLTR